MSMVVQALQCSVQCAGRPHICPWMLPDQVAVQRWVDANVWAVFALYEDRHDLWGITGQGRLIRRALPARRSKVRCLCAGARAPAHALHPAHACQVHNYMCMIQAWLVDERILPYHGFA